MRLSLASAQARRRALGCRGSACARPRCARVPCDARSWGPLHNSLHSLRSLRSLWSNRCNESAHEARAYARGPKPWPCRPHRAQRPGRSQGTNGPPDRWCPCSLSRRRNSPRQPSARRLAGSIALRVLTRAISLRLAGPRGDACRGELRTRRLNPGRCPPSGQAPKRALVFRKRPQVAIGTAAFHASRLAHRFLDH